MFYHKLKQELEKRGLKLSPFLKELGFSTSNATKWKNGNLPDSEILIRICEALSISSDYLLGLSEEKSQHQNNAGHNRLTELYNELNAEGKEKLLDYADDLVESGKYKKDSQISTAAV